MLESSQIHKRSRLLVVQMVILSAISSAASPKPLSSRLHCSNSFTGEEQLIMFLNEQAATRADPPCVEYAIEELEALRSAKAVPVLIKLLDFSEPMSIDEENARMLVASSHHATKYKAIEALFNIGEAAIPSLIEVLRNPATPPVRFKNALTAYLDIRRENPEDARKFLSNTIASDLCPSFQNAKAEILVSFLEGNAGKTTTASDSKCVISAIFQLGIVGTAKTSKVLMSYLDYKSPFPSTNDSDASDPDHPLLYTQQHYPAVTVLCVIGSPALIPLLRTLDIAPSTARSKAVETIMLIYAEYPPQGVEVVNSAAVKGGKPTATGGTQLAASAIQWCDIDHRAKCEEVLRRAH